MANGVKSAKILSSPLGPSAPQDKAVELNYRYQVPFFNLLGYQKEHANEISLKQKILALYKHCEENNDPEDESPSSHAIWSQVEINDSWAAASGDRGGFGGKMGLDSICRMSTYQFRVMKSFNTKNIGHLDTVLKQNFVNKGKRINPVKGKYVNFGYDHDDDFEVWFSDDWLKGTVGQVEDQLESVDRGSMGNLLSLTLRENDLKEKKVSALLDIRDFLRAPGDADDVPGDFNFNFSKHDDYTYNDKLAVLWQTLTIVNESQPGRQLLANQFEAVMQGQTPLFNPFNAIDPPIATDESGGVLAQTDDKVIAFCLPRMIYILESGLAEAIKRWENDYQRTEKEKYKDWIQKAWSMFALRRWRVLIGQSQIYHGSEGNREQVNNPLTYGDWDDRIEGKLDSGPSDQQIAKTTKNLGRKETGGGGSYIESEYGVAIGTIDTMIETGVSGYTIPDNIKGKSFVTLAGYIWSLAMVADSTAFDLIYPDQSSEITTEEVHAGLSALKTVTDNKEVVVFNRMIKVSAEEGMLSSAGHAATQYRQLSAAEDVNLAKNFLSQGERVFYGLVGTVGMGLDAMTCYWEVNDGLDEYGNEDTSAAIGHFLEAAATGTGAALAAYATISGAAAAWGSGAMQIVMSALTAVGPGGWIVAAGLLLASAISFIFLNWTDETLLEEYVMNSKFGTAWDRSQYTKDDPGKVDFRFTHVRQYSNDAGKLVETRVPNLPRQLTETPGLNFQLDNMEKVEYEQEYWQVDFTLNRDLISSGEVVFLMDLIPREPPDRQVETAHKSRVQYLPQPIKEAAYVLPYDEDRHRPNRWFEIGDPVTEIWNELGLSNDSKPDIGNSSIGLCPTEEWSSSEIVYRAYHPATDRNPRPKLFGLDPSQKFTTDVYIEAAVVSRDVFESLGRMVKKLEGTKETETGNSEDAVGLGDLLLENLPSIKRDRAPIMTQAEDDSYMPFYG